MEWGCSRLHVVSTGNRADDAFAKLYEKATAGRGVQKTLFVSSNAGLRRDTEWYRTNIEEATDPESARREHARTPEDAVRWPKVAYCKRFRSKRPVADVAVINN